MGCEQSTDANSNSKLVNNKVTSNGNVVPVNKSNNKQNGKIDSHRHDSPSSSSNSQTQYRKEHQQQPVKLKNNSYQDVSDDEANKTRIEMLPVETVQSLLQEYKESDEAIKILEQKDPLTVFYIKNLQLKQIEDKIAVQVSSIDELKKRNHFIGSKKNPAGVKDVLLKLDNKNSVSRDEQDILVKANKFEIATTELEMLHQERSLVENEVTQRFVTLSQLRNAYQRQEEIIEKLNLNEQLSEEIPLQNDLTELELKRMTVSETYERWKEGKTLIGESCRQFTEARKKWNEFGDSESFSSLPLHSIHYELGEEVRDNLISAWQGLHNAKFYLQCDLPYCTDTELATLQKATSYLFIDLMSEARRMHAESCYVAAHRRTVALLAWVTKVNENMLEPELEKLNETLHNKIEALSMIRIDYICSQYPELDTTMTRPVHKILTPTPPTPPPLPLPLPPPPTTTTEQKIDDDTIEVLSSSSRSRVRIDSIPFLTSTLDTESLKLLSELNLNHLATLPTKEELFRKTGSENSNKSSSDNSGISSHDNGSIISTANSQQRSQSRIQCRKASIDKNLTDLELTRGWSNASRERRTTTANGFTK